MRIVFEGPGPAPKEVARAIAHHASGLARQLGARAEDAILHVELTYDLREDSYLARVRLELERPKRQYATSAQRALRVTAVCAALDQLAVITHHDAPWPLLATAAAR
jgi:hypothetical protein